MLPSVNEILKWCKQDQICWFNESTSIHRCDCFILNDGFPCGGRAAIDDCITREELRARDQTRRGQGMLKLILEYKKNTGTERVRSSSNTTTGFAETRDQRCECWCLTIDRIAKCPYAKISREANRRRLQIASSGVQTLSKAQNTACSYDWNTMIWNCFCNQSTADGKCAILDRAQQVAQKKQLLAQKKINKKGFRLIRRLTAWSNTIFSATERRTETLFNLTVNYFSKNFCSSSSIHEIQTHQFTTFYTT